MTNLCAGEIVVDMIDVCAFDDGGDCPGSRTIMLFTGLDLSRRAWRACFDAGCLLIADLLQTTPSRLLVQPNVGPKTVLEIRQVLRDHGFDWAPEWQFWAAMERRK